MKIPILYRKELREYDFGWGHPFGGERFEIFFNFLKENLPQENYQILEAEPAKDEDLSLICKKEYIDFVRSYYRKAYFGKSLPPFDQVFKYLSQDNIPGKNPGKLEEAARLIVGQMKMAVDLIVKGKLKKVVSIGGGLHHASETYGEGFCLYNDVAFGAKYLIKKYNFERILILDTDAHAGNGTSHYFYEDPRVLFIDIHQDPRYLYPGKGFVEEIGEGKGVGFNVNCPLPPGAGWPSYQYLFEKVVFPLAEEFQPQIILRNGGTDPYWNDPLTHLNLKISDFRKIGQMVRELAKISEGKEIDMIASGYNEKAIGPGWLALISGISGIKLKIEEPEPIPQRLKKDIHFKETKEMVKKLKSQLKNYWKCFSLEK